MTLSQRALFLIASVTNSNQPIPTLGRHILLSSRAVVTHAASTGSAMMDRKLGTKFGLTLVTLFDQVVRNPVVWSGRVFD